MPKISVVVAVYNVEPYLRRSLDCLVNQTMRDLEFICVDDCSTDGSLKILKEYAGKDDRFKIITMKQNKGASATRNKGLEVATGEYLSIIDPDDSIDLNYYEELYKKAKEDDYDIVKCPRQNIFTDGSQVTGPIYSKIKRHGLYGFMFEHTTAIYKMSIIRDNDIKFLESLCMYGDIVFLNKIVFNSKNIALVDNVQYYYYKRDNSLNTSQLSKKQAKSANTAACLVMDNINTCMKKKRNREGYISLYYYFLISIVGNILYRSNDKEIQYLVSKTLIEYYFKCLNTERLKKHFKYKSMLKYIYAKDADALVKYFSRYNNYKNFRRQLTPLEKLFSLKNVEQRGTKYKEIVVLGKKIRIRHWKNKCVSE